MRPSMCHHEVKRGTWRDWTCNLCGGRGGVDYPGIELEGYELPVMFQFPNVAFGADFHSVQTLMTTMVRLDDWLRLY